MRGGLRASATGLLALLASSAVHGGTPTTVEMTCPVGGKRFNHLSTMSLSTWGTRPDGKPYTSWISPMPMAVCPDNGLVIYKDFSADEIARLEPLLKSPAYVALRAEAPRYRAAWLLQALDREKIFSRLWLINQASWEADGDPARKARYKREFAEGVAAVPPAPDNPVWLNMQIQAANAWRELGEMDRARAAIAALPLAELDLPVPGLEAGEKAIETAEGKRAIVAFARSIGALVEQGDRSAEPLSLIPRRIAAERCRALGEDASRADRDFCNSATISAPIRRSGDD